MNTAPVSSSRRRGRTAVLGMFVLILVAGLLVSAADAGSKSSTPPRAAALRSHVERLRQMRAARSATPAPAPSRPATVNRSASTPPKPPTVTRPSTTVRKPPTVTRSPTTLRKPPTVTRSSTVTRNPPTVLRSRSTPQPTVPGVTRPSTTIRTPSTVTRPSTTIRKPPTVTRPSTTIRTPPTVTRPSTTIRTPPTVTRPSTPIRTPPTVTRPSTTIRRPPTVSRVPSVSRSGSRDDADRPVVPRSHVEQLRLQRDAIQRLRDLQRDQDLESRVVTPAPAPRSPGDGGAGYRPGHGHRPPGNYHDHDDHHPRRPHYRCPHGYYPYRHCGSSIFFTWPSVYYRTYPETVTYTETVVVAQPQTQVVEEPVVVAQPQVVQQQAVVVDANDHGAEASAWAWTLVRSDRPDEALEVFSHLARTYPDAGVPRIGEAVALALLGQPERAAWAMRRAIRIDPEAVGFVPADDLVRERLQALVEVYRAREANSISAKDSAFMQAALHAIRGEAEAAHLMADVARQTGDDTEGAAVLKGYLTQQFPR